MAKKAQSGAKGTTTTTLKDLTPKSDAKVKGGTATAKQKQFLTNNF